MLTCLTALLSACSQNSHSAIDAANQPTAVPVALQLATPQTWKEELQAVGSLQAEESVTISTEIAGRIARIDFVEGEPARAGQQLIQLDDAVHRAQFEQAQANLRLSRRNAQRAEELAQRNLISAGERDQARAQLALDRARLALAEAQLKKTRITAPFDGMLGLRQVGPGDYIEAGKALVTLDAVARMKVEFETPERYLGQLKAGQTINVALDAFPGQSFQGQTYAVDSRVNPQTRAITVRAWLDNPQARLKPGQFARIRILINERPKAIVIPEQALIARGERAFVYVVADDKAELRQVRLGGRKPGWVEISDGLDAGEPFVTSGIQRLGPGTPVRLADDADQAPVALDEHPAPYH
ncbi:MAG: efflux RND transporter periplasmic adaptor subunit [Panacagrimonas sp.]